MELLLSVLHADMDFIFKLISVVQRVVILLIIKTCGSIHVTHAAQTVEIVLLGLPARVLIVDLGKFS